MPDNGIQSVADGLLYIFKVKCSFPVLSDNVISR